MVSTSHWHHDNVAARAQPPKAPMPTIGGADGLRGRCSRPSAAAGDTLRDQDAESKAPDPRR
jgi:hypothetical protein